MKKSLLLSLLLISSLFSDSELDAIKEQLKTQQTQIEALRQKSTNKSASFSQNAYMPYMMIILNMSALTRDVSNNDYAYYNIPGFIDNNNTVENELPFNPNKGFNFNYAEIALSSTVDPYLDSFVVFHLRPDIFEIEEAYVRTRSLPFGLRIKAGKFRSDFGRINRKHQHSWNFSSQPIIYEAFFGVESNNDAGIELNWVAPTDTYLMAGIEWMQGSNKISFGDTKHPASQYNAYIKSFLDIGENLSVFGGLSLAHGRNDTINITNNITNIYDADLTFRYQLGSYSSVVWQSEYLHRDKNIGISTERQAGFYSEINYDINRNYSFGLRYDDITKNIVAADNLDRYTTKLDYKPSTMSRIRLQYTQDNTKIIADERTTTHEILLSLNITAGAHAAHNY